LAIVAANMSVSTGWAVFCGFVWKKLKLKSTVCGAVLWVDWGFESKIESNFDWRIQFSIQFLIKFSAQ
jgi:hypothetical protein